MRISKYDLVEKLRISSTSFNALRKNGKINIKGTLIGRTLYFDINVGILNKLEIIVSDNKRRLTKKD
jgi:hypothetical protein